MKNINYITSLTFSLGLLSLHALLAQSDKLTQEPISSIVQTRCEYSNISGYTGNGEKSNFRIDIAPEMQMDPVVEVAALTKLLEALGINSAERMAEVEAAKNAIEAGIKEKTKAVLAAETEIREHQESPKNKFSILPNFSSKIITKTTTKEIAKDEVERVNNINIKNEWEKKAALFRDKRNEEANPLKAADFAKFAQIYEIASDEIEQAKSVWRTLKDKKEANSNEKTAYIDLLKQAVDLANKTPDERSKILFEQADTAWDGINNTAIWEKIVQGADKATSVLQYINLLGVFSPAAITQVISLGAAAMDRREVATIFARSLEDSARKYYAKVVRIEIGKLVVSTEPDWEDKVKNKVTQLKNNLDILEITQGSRDIERATVYWKAHKVALGAFKKNDALREAAMTRVKPYKDSAERINAEAIDLENVAKAIKRNRNIDNINFAKEQKASSAAAEAWSNAAQAYITMFKKTQKEDIDDKDIAEAVVSAEVKAAAWKADALCLEAKKADKEIVASSDIQNLIKQLKQSEDAWIEAVDGYKIAVVKATEANVNYAKLTHALNNAVSDREKVTAQIEREKEAQVKMVSTKTASVVKEQLDNPIIDENKEDIGMSIYEILIYEIRKNILTRYLEDVNALTLDGNIVANNKFANENESNNAKQEADKKHEKAKIDYDIAANEAKEAIDSAIRLQGKAETAKEEFSKSKNINDIDTTVRAADCAAKAAMFAIVKQFGQKIAHAKYDVAYARGVMQAFEAVKFAKNEDELVEAGNKGEINLAECARSFIMWSTEAAQLKNILKKLFANREALQVALQARDNISKTAENELVKAQEAESSWAKAAEAAEVARKINAEWAEEKARNSHFGADTTEKEEAKVVEEAWKKAAIAALTERAAWLVEIEKIGTEILVDKAINDAFNALNNWRQNKDKKLIETDSHTQEGERNFLNEKTENDWKNYLFLAENAEKEAVKNKINGDENTKIAWSNVINDTRMASSANAIWASFINSINDYNQAIAKKESSIAKQAEKSWDEESKAAEIRVNKISKNLDNNEITDMKSKKSVPNLKNKKNCIVM